MSKKELEARVAALEAEVRHLTDHVQDKADRLTCRVCHRREMGYEK